MARRQHFKLMDRARSFQFAGRGIWELVRSQHNAWIHLLATMGAITLAFTLRVNSIEWALLLLCIGLVWTAEAINTAIEAAVDLTSPDPHPLAKRAKDVAAGSVLLAAITAFIIGMIIFVPKLKEWMLTL